MRTLSAILVFPGLLSAYGWALPVNAGTDSGIHLEQPVERDIFSVVIIADRTGGTEADIAILAQAVDEVNRLNPDVVIHIGDMVNGYTYNPDVWKQQMLEFKEVIAKLHAPFYPLAGNHDTFPGSGNPSDRTNEELHKQYFAPLYYSFDYRNSHFICLYSDEARTSRPLYSAEQLAWLERDLAGCDKENIFVFSHKPTWEYRGGIWDPIHEILKDYPVRAVFGGHFHTYQKCDLRDGIQYYVVAATGGFLHKPKVGGGFHHLTLLSVEGSAFSVALLEVGSVMPDNYVEANDYREFSQLDPLYNRETGATGAVPDPVDGEVDAEVPIRLRNPLDKPVRVRVQLSAEKDPWDTVPKESIVEVPARKTITTSLRLRSPQIAADEFVVPEVLITYLYEDSQGRTVPVEIRSRVPTGRSATIKMGFPSITIDGNMKEPAWRDAPVLPVRFWRYSMYDVEADRPPEVRLLLDEDFLFLFADVIDDHLAIFDGGPGKVVMSDSIVLSALSSDGGTRELLFEVLQNGSNRLYKRLKTEPYWEPWPLGEDDFLHRMVRTEGGYRLEARIATSVLFGESGLESGRTRFNVAIYDNDFNPYPFVRRWAAEDSEHWGTLIITE